MKRRSTALLSILALVSAVHAPLAQERAVIEPLEHLVAVDDVCAWPNLTLMPDGDIIATIFTEPSHGKEEGDVQCHVSRDGGRTWSLAGTPFPHEPGRVRMNVAAGLANDGALVVIVSGWGGKDLREYIAPLQVCRSYDGGETWTHEGMVEHPPGEPDLIPFGDVIPLGNGRVACSCYGYTGRKSRPAYVFFSEDDGRTWGDAVPMGRFGNGPGEWNQFNETAFLPVEGDRWIAVPRMLTSESELIVSGDGGRTWDVPVFIGDGTFTRKSEHPGHLTRLRDGRILYTFGVRWGEHGTAYRVSADGGRSWTDTAMVAYYGGRDGGYPASVQLRDGTIVTAYYCDANDMHPRYHMGVVRWRLPE